MSTPVCGRLGVQGRRENSPILRQTQSQSINEAPRAVKEVKLCKKSKIRDWDSALSSERPLSRPSIRLVQFRYCSATHYSVCLIWTPRVPAWASISLAQSAQGDKRAA